MDDEGCREEIRPLLPRGPPLVDEDVGERRRRVPDILRTGEQGEQRGDPIVYRCAAPDIGGVRSPRVHGRLVGLIVDRVSDVLRVSRDAIRPPPLLTQNERARYFAGVCHHRGRILMVLDLDAILSSTEKISLAGLNQAAKGAPQ